MWLDQLLKTPVTLTVPLRDLEDAHAAFIFSPRHEAFHGGLARCPCWLAVAIREAHGYKKRQRGKYA